MSISPTCDKCKQELTEFGAILFGPPNHENEVKKFHICRLCYDQIKEELNIENPAS